MSHYSSHSLLRVTGRVIFIRTGPQALPQIQGVKSFPPKPGPRKMAERQFFRKKKAIVSPEEDTQTKPYPHSSYYEYKFFSSFSSSSSLLLPSKFSKESFTKMNFQWLNWNIKLNGPFQCGHIHLSCLASSPALQWLLTNITKGLHPVPCPHTAFFYNSFLLFCVS